MFTGVTVWYALKQGPGIEDNNAIVAHGWHFQGEVHKSHQQEHIVEDEDSQSLFCLLCRSIWFLWILQTCLQHDFWNCLALTTWLPRPILQFDQVQSWGYSSYFVLFYISVEIIVSYVYRTYVFLWLKASGYSTLLHWLCDQLPERVRHFIQRRLQ